MIPSHEHDVSTTTQPVTVDLEIENAYADSVSVTHVHTVSVQRPASFAEHELGDWACEQLFPFTGTGREDGPSLYIVTVTGASDPGLIGRTFELG